MPDKLVKINIKIGFGGMKNFDLDTTLDVIHIPISKDKKKENIYNSATVQDRNLIFSLKRAEASPLYYSQLTFSNILKKKVVGQKPYFTEESITILLIQESRLLIGLNAMTGQAYTVPFRHYPISPVNVSELFMVPSGVINMT